MNNRLRHSHKAVYEQLCASYLAIDDFRAKLLGLLPLASGTGIFLLYSNQGALSAETKAFLTPIGLFGLIVTLGLFMYEIYGIRKCHALIVAGRQLEISLHSDGQFLKRPRSVLGVINEPFAAGIIYPAVFAAWAYVSMVIPWPQIGLPAALAIFVIGFGVTLSYNLYLKHVDDPTDIIRVNECLLDA